MGARGCQRRALGHDKHEDGRGVEQHADHPAHGDRAHALAGRARRDRQLGGGHVDLRGGWLAGVGAVVENTSPLQGPLLRRNIMYM